MSVRDNGPAPDDVKTARECVHYSQAEAAAVVHVDLRSWQKWEGGERQMHPAFFELFLIKTRQRRRMIERRGA